MAEKQPDEFENPEEISLKENSLEPEEPLEETEEEPSQPEPPIIRSKFAFSLLILLVVIIPILGFLGIGIPADTDSLFVGTIRTQENGALEIPIHTTSSSLAFCLTTQKLEDGVLYLKPRLSFASFLHESGDTTIITKEPSEKLTAIYLQGSEKEDLLQIWP